MSLTPTYTLALTAQSRLIAEVARVDQNLRFLVGRASLLDSLIDVLPAAEIALLNQECDLLQSRSNPTSAPDSNERRPTTGTELSNINVSGLSLEKTSVDLLPIILIVGPPGSGKGTLSKRLAADFNLYHLSVGDWLREQAQPPIAGVSERVNRYVFQNETIPDSVLQEEYGGLEKVPAPLMLYQCGKLNISTLESLKINAMPALKDACERISAQGQVKGILVDNLQQSPRHCAAATQMFGAAFPNLLISVDCADETAKGRFLARARGTGDAARFDRRIARFRKDYASMVNYYEASGAVVRVAAKDDADEVYRSLLLNLVKCEAWRELLR